ncbi:MAG: hypothetical protein DBY25_02590 [Clostridiales bacterium]|nr:MAG: hypothetical protein DBY25_02590 [Clostridiales bacterium]
MVPSSGIWAILPPCGKWIAIESACNGKALQSRKLFRVVKKAVNFTKSLFLPIIFFIISSKPGDFKFYCRFRAGFIYL